MTHQPFPFRHATATAAIVSGLATLMAAAGVQGKANGTDEVDPYAGNIRLFGGLQLLLFAGGLLICICAGFRAMG